ncbi:hypothetical protein LRD18_08790 [Halorhodospira halochloris]|uniref:Uncharacterized protein n=1 Tax=Halorhodospira halochloris TaxID=1052 RepID=A0A0X8X927_HALHR|nr:hypothetical protein [Halorhodospira halochloris]MCG5530967.1 hypothetical protein [Halorhodospira halochloris]MCG5548748.1 hypothetical protein [Halorhodospira halochloris]BAU57198.1 hypothetical protein HH1059_05150 [Halorhodospira halochloris]
MAIKMGVRGNSRGGQILPQLSPQSLAEKHQKARPRDRDRIEQEIYRRARLGHTIPPSEQASGGRMIPKGHS